MRYDLYVSEETKALVELFFEKLRKELTTAQAVELAERFEQIAWDGEYDFQGDDIPVVFKNDLQNFFLTELEHFHVDLYTKLYPIRNLYAPERLYETQMCFTIDFKNDLDCDLFEILHDFFYDPYVDLIAERFPTLEVDHISGDTAFNPTRHFLDFYCKPRPRAQRRGENGKFVSKIGTRQVRVDNDLYDVLTQVIESSEKKIDVSDLVNMILANEFEFFSPADFEDFVEEQLEFLCEKYQVS